MVYLIFLFLLLFLLTLFIINIPGRVWSYYKMCKALRDIPSIAPPHWFWGHLHIAEPTQAFQDKVYKWRIENNSKMDLMWFGPNRPMIGIQHPDLIKTLWKLSKPDGVYHLLSPWLGRGLLIENGPRWFKNRRILTPAFHFDVLKPYIHVYNDCTDILLAKWDRYAVEGNPVPVYQTINLLTLDVILRCACSHYSNCQNKETDPYVKAVRELVNLSGERFLSPLASASNFLYLYCTPDGWKYRAALKEAHQHSEKLIKERKESLLEERRNSVDVGIRKRRESLKSKCLDFLDVLLEMNSMETEDRLTDLEIRHEVDTFVFEGYDTTANALTWTLYFLAKYPEHQDKCREEVKDVLRGRTHLDYDDLSKLQYTQSCIKEAMRICPPVFCIFRELNEDTVIGGHRLHKGLSVSINIISIHRNPQVWENPLEYNPLRFHPDHMKESDRDPFSFIPFSAGPRNCIGQNFAFNEEQIVIASIVNRYSMEIIDERVKERLEAVPNVLLRPAEELYLKLTLVD